MHAINSMVANFFQSIISSGSIDEVKYLIAIINVAKADTKITAIEDIKRYESSVANDCFIYILNF